MYYKVLFDIDKFKFWSGAVDTIKNLQEEGYSLDDISAIIEDTFDFDENVPTETDINDFVWFDLYDMLHENDDIESSRRIRGRRVMASARRPRRICSSRYVRANAWVAPNGKKYGKQSHRFKSGYLFTKKELQNMVDTGIATDMAGTFDPMSMHYDVIGFSWNETNGYKSGILIKDLDNGELYVGNQGDAMVAHY